MDWISWALMLALCLMSGAVGAVLYSRRAALLRAVAPYWVRLRRHLHKEPPAEAPPAAPRRWNAADDIVVLIPDGRPWPLGPALQLLELAWRWQVVHGANLPLRARQGEGAYVWRPPLPARSDDQPRAES